MVAGHEIEGAGNLFLGAVLPLIKAVRVEMEEHENSWKYVPGKEIINLQFYYPILLTKGELYECFLGGKKPAYKRVHRINYIRRHKSAKVQGEFRIDVVTERGFRRLLKTVETEISEIARRIKRKKAILRDSANKIAREKLKEGRKKTKKGARKQNRH
ncbi:MAG: hypothetical protein WAN12_12555 [Candidatus Acidiferrum sp.]